MWRKIHFSLISVDNFVEFFHLIVIWAFSSTYLFIVTWLLHCSKSKMILKTFCYWNHIRISSTVFIQLYVCLSFFIVQSGWRNITRLNATSQNEIKMQHMNHFKELLFFAVPDLFSLVIAQPKKNNKLLACKFLAL